MKPREREDFSEADRPATKGERRQGKRTNVRKMRVNGTGNRLSQRIIQERAEGQR